MKPLVQEDCAILIGGIDGFIFAGKKLGLSDVGCHLIARNGPDKSAWLGFDIHFPVGQDNEDNGFGMCYSWSESQGKAVPAETYAITVKFPRTNVSRIIRPTDATTRSRFPDENRELSVVEVFLGDEAEVVVEGYGMPYSNKGHIAEKWLHENMPVTNDVTLIGLIEQRSFVLVVAAEDDKLGEDWNFNLLPPPFRYPYGTDHAWLSQSQYSKILRNRRGHQFSPRISFDNINELLTVLSQSQVQDILWVEEEAAEMRKTELPAYFVRARKELEYNESDDKEYYAIVALPPEFRITFESAWRRLAKEGRLKILLYKKSYFKVGIQSPDAHWDALIVETPSARDVLQAHPIEDHELALYVRRPSWYEERRGSRFGVTRFQDHFNTNLKDFERKVDEVARLFGIHSKPSNIAALEQQKLLGTQPKAWEIIVKRAKFHMHLHKDLLLGTGFYNTLRVKPAVAGGEIETTLADLRLNSGSYLPLPIIPLLDVTDRDFLGALMQEALPEDRFRLTEYLRNRPLGLGIIIAPPGFGKTTVLAVGALAMAQTLGKLYLSGPTHVSVDNAAARLDVVSDRVTKRLNDKLGQSDDSPKYRRKLIIRAYKISAEITAFKNLLRSPNNADKVSPKSAWSSDPKWKLHLSLAYWALAVLKSPIVRQLGADDKADLFAIRDRCDKKSSCLRDVAAGTISWERYERKGRIAADNEIKGIMTAIIHVADVVATTPYLACKEPFLEWKQKKARGFVIDEAANMNRPDLLCVWGNACHPCLLAGDERQLPPTVMTKHERDGQGNFLNRFAGDGGLSPIHHFKSMGWPIYRPRVQLRMAVGQFDLTHHEVYREIPFTYGPGCDITLPQHEIGRKLERYLRQRFPKIKAAPAGKLSPVFIHCQGTQSSQDKFSGSTRNPDQVKVALKLLADFAKSSGARPQDMAIISPYTANVNTIEKFRKRQEFSVLQPMRPTATVDSFQGQEAEIVMIIMGTTSSSGPGFTADEHRLNVLLSRHKSGLIIVGDINVTGDVMKPDTPFEGMVVISRTGEKYFETCNMLRNIHFALHAASRVARVQVVSV